MLLQRQVDRTRASLPSSLDALGAAILDTYATASSMGGLPATTGRVREVRSREADSPRPCDYCGSVVVEEESGIPFTRHRRRFGNCFGCGVVFGGDPEVTRTLEVEVPARAAGPVTVRVPVHNPYPVPSRPAPSWCSAGSTRRFPIRPVAPRRSGSPRREERSQVQLTPEPTDSLVAGVYYLSAVAVAGRASRSSAGC